MQQMIDERYAHMPWDEIDAVVFDIGRVLIEFTPEIYVKTLFPGDEKKQQHILKNVYGSPYWPQLDRGPITHEEAAQKIAEESGGDPADHLLAMRGWSDHIVMMEEGWRTVQACRAHGKRIYLLSNYNKDCFARLMELHGERFSVFDGRCISYESQQMKPEPEIYQRLINTYRLTPARTLFIDDVLANVEGAMRMGINGFQMNRTGKMDAFFQNAAE